MDIYFSICRISFATPEDERARLVSKLKDLYVAQDFKKVLKRVEICLPEGAEGEKSDVACDLLAFLAGSRTRWEHSRHFLRESRLVDSYSSKRL